MPDLHRVRTFELASVTACEAVLAQDIRSHGPIPTESGVLNYYVGINTWLNLVSDWCGGIYQNLFDVMADEGLIAVIQRFSDAADLLIREEPITDSLVNDVLSRVAVYPNSCEWIRSLSNPVLVLKLEICRFLKRFSMPFPNDAESAMVKFSETQVQVASEWDYNSDVMSPARKIALVWASRELDAVPWDRINHIFDMVDSSAREFTVGAALETGRSRERKLLAMWNQNPEFFRPPFGSFGVEMPTPQLEQYRWVSTAATIAYYDDPSARYHPVKLSTAPKSAKGPRIIAMEPLQYQTTTKWIQQRLYDIQIPGMDLKDQTINQDLAICGSKDQSFATIDLSAASDFVSKGLVRYLFPDEAFTRFVRYAPTHWRRPDQPLDCELSSFATMGNGLTFWVESLVFWAIARGAVRAAGGDPDLVSVYGDDIVVPGDTYEAVVASLCSCGFVVNRSKSFGTGFFRESCGIEALHGEVIPSVYFPRFPLSGEITGHTCTLHETCDPDGPDRVLSDSTSRLIQLQHRLYSLSIRASRFVAAVVLDAQPDMTVSCWGDETATDLWGSAAIRPKAPALYGKVIQAGIRTWTGKLNGDPMTAPRRPVHYGPSWGMPVLRAPLFDDDSWTMTCYPVVKRRGTVNTVARALQRAVDYQRFLREGPVPLYPDDSVSPCGYAPGYSMTQPALSPDEQLKSPSVTYKLRRTV